MNTERYLVLVPGDGEDDPSSVGWYSDGSFVVNGQDDDGDYGCFRTSKMESGSRYFIHGTPRDPARKTDESSGWLCVADYTGPDYVEPVTTKRLRTTEEMDAMLAAAQTKKSDPDALPRLTSRLRGIAWRLEGIMQDPKLDEESMLLAKKALALTVDALKEASENDR